MKESIIRKAVCKCGYTKVLKDGEFVPDICPACLNGKPVYWERKADKDYGVIAEDLF